MPYSSTITRNSLKTRALFKFAGVPRYLATWGDPDSDTYDDSTGGNTHGSLAVDGRIQSVKISPGKLDHKRGLVTATTMTIRMLDSPYWRAMFGRRCACQYLESDLAANGTQADISDNSGYSTDDYFHLGQETAQVSGKTGGDKLDCSPAGTYRGVLGTIAEKHPTGTEVGDKPRHWVRRKVWFVLGAWNGADWDYHDPDRVMYVEKSPKFCDGIWTISLSNSLELFQRKFYTNFPDVPAREIARYTVSNQLYYYIYVDDSRSFKEPGDLTKQRHAVWLQAGDLVGCFLLDDVDTTDHILKLHPYHVNLVNREQRVTDFILSLRGPWDGSGPVVLPDVTARCVFPMLGGVSGDPNPAVAALRIMLSNDGTGSGYDVLPGDDATEEEDERRAGCGLTTDEVDNSTIAAIARDAAPHSGFIVGACGEESLIDLLTKDAGPLLPGYWYVNNEGKISFLKYDASVAGAAVDYTLDATKRFGPHDAVDDEDPIVGTIKIDADYDWVTQKFRRRHAVNYKHLHHTYRDKRNELVISSRMAGVTYEQVMATFDHVVGRWGEGARRFSPQAPWGASILDPGDTVSFTDSRVPAFDGSEDLGVSGVVCEVIQVRPEYDQGRVGLDLVERPSCKLIAPIAKCATKYSATQFSMTALYSDHGIDSEWPTTGSWKVIFVDPSGALRSGGGSTVATISSITGSIVNWTGGPNDVAVNDLMIFADYDDADGANTNAQGAAQRDFAFMSEAGENPDPGHQWG